MIAVLNWIAALLTRCWCWFKQVSQRSLAALMMILMPVSFGLISINRNLSSPSPTEHSRIATIPLLPEARVEELPVQEDDRRGKMAERRTERQRLELSGRAAEPELGPVLLPTMLEHMGTAAAWNYQTLLPAANVYSAAAAAGSLGFLSNT